jgi:hypothetical protein
LKVTATLSGDKVCKTAERLFYTAKKLRLKAYKNLWDA